jgi:DNA-binding transcriptional LysR family regulator
MPRQGPTHQMIEAFRAVIMNDGVSAAADALGMSQSSVSRLISELQRVVGFQLFAKHGRTVRATEEALALMTKVQQSFLGLEDIGRFAEQMRKQRMGRLSICAIPAIAHSVIPDAMEFLRRKYPDVLVTLDIASSIEVVRSVLNRQADVGFAAHGLAVGEAQNVAEVIADCMCIAAVGGFPSELKHVEPQQLSGRPFVALTGTLQKRLEAMLRDVGVELDIMAEASQSLSCSELVMRGAGISIVDPFTGVLHRSRGGIALPLRPALAYKVQAIAMGDARLSAQAKDLVHYLESAAQTIRDTCG